ncbi:hypothetical protein ACRUMN_05735 [Kluyvera cryocrescens]|uniref:hypothetical protein n=1 Tax=Kluyvera cryocrescens TaxID=580 RepID=UPI00290FFC8C|nr:hypothetical protein [Clostridiales bacterium]
MMTIENDERTVRLKSVVRSGINLPSHVFHTKFMRYYFFDNDIGSSEYLINASKIIISQALHFKGAANVYSSTDFRYWGDLSTIDNWAVKINELRLAMENDGDYGGFIILDERKQWVIFQWHPVDIGILGINTSRGLDNISNIIYECFFDCTILNQWFERSQQHEGYLESLGLDSAFVMQLIENYS